jgi:hypothetical protein
MRESLHVLNTQRAQIDKKENRLIKGKKLDEQIEMAVSGDLKTLRGRTQNPRGKHFRERDITASETVPYSLYSALLLTRALWEPYRYCSKVVHYIVNRASFQEHSLSLSACAS